MDLALKVIERSACFHAQCVKMKRTFSTIACALLFVLFSALSTNTRCLAQSHGDSTGVHGYLQARLAQQPHDATAWRLLGQLRQKEGDLPGAVEALRKAAQYDPQNASVQFHLAEILNAQGDVDQARTHYQRVVQLAPESRYAKLAAQHAGIDSEPQITLASYEITRFDDSQRLEDSRQLRDELNQPYALRFETGLLYNTNVALTPISRGLFPGTRDSFQVFLSPEFEFNLIDHDGWLAGPLVRGEFTRNESDFDQFDLQSYTGGAFVERAYQTVESLLVPRMAYEFTLDQFDGETFGDRHRLTTSLASYWNNGNITVFAWTVDYTDFAFDGPFPDLTSRDGWTNTLSLGQSWLIGGPWVYTVGAGIDVERTDVVWDDFDFFGVSLYADTEWTLSECVSLILEAGIGYRDYSEASFPLERNEIIYRGGAKLRRYITDQWSVSAVFNYDRFDSDNELFAAERAVMGVITTIER